MQVNAAVLLAVCPPGREGGTPCPSRVSELLPGAVEPCGGWEPLVASGSGVLLGGFHKPGQGQARGRKSWWLM